MLVSSILYYISSSYISLSVFNALFSFSAFSYILSYILLLSMSSESYYSSTSYFIFILNIISLWTIKNILNNILNKCFTIKIELILLYLKYKIYY